jgi:hypothetical protein
VGEEETSVEFSVMIMGGAASVKQEGDTLATMSMEHTPKSMEIIGTDDFWKDLKRFLTQRLKDQEEGEWACELFRKAWENSGAL